MIYKNVLMAVTLVLLAGCGGGGSDSGGGDTGLTVSACSTSGDDSTLSPGISPDRETDFVRSHTQGSPTYHQLATRQLTDGTPVSLEYMVHTPTGTPSGLVVLIAGGGMNAGIEGSGGSVTASRGNFLVRSAHRFMRAGYTVVTIDRPSDFADYGSIDSASYLYDAYRNSMDHAVDLAAVINAVNTDNLPVIIAGTSRGAISAVANNTLAAGIAISSPVTRSGGGGSPVGSGSLPVSTIQRPVHLLIHENDACTGTSPANSRALFGDIEDSGIDIEGDAVSGGFRDTVRNDVCGAFDYHGFTGIENCAVSKETAWMDKLTTSLGTNTPPEADNGTFSGVSRVDLSSLSSDADGDTLSYSLPYDQSVLGGAISVDPATGIVSYVSPASSAEDSFAYVVTDGAGGVATAVVRITTP